MELMEYFKSWQQDEVMQRSCCCLSLPGSKCVFLCVYPQLHFFDGLSQEEKLFDLPLILAVETQKVLLCHLLRGNGLVSKASRLGVIGLEKLVEIALDSELIL